MTFDEAIIKKEKQLSIEDRDQEWDLCVAPHDFDEMLEYVEFYRARNLHIDDELAQEFTTTNTYCLCWIARKDSSLGYERLDN